MHNVLFNFFHLEIRLYHTGTDGGLFEWVKVVTNSGKMYQCDFGVFIDGDGYMKGTNCKSIN